jgi:hypothetical protein
MGLALLTENPIRRGDEPVTFRAKKPDDLGAVTVGMHDCGQQFAIARTADERRSWDLRKMLGHYLPTVTVADRQLI